MGVEVVAVIPPQPHLHHNFPKIRRNLADPNPRPDIRRIDVEQELEKAIVHHDERILAQRARY